jgi:hypothetical protein
LFQRFMTSQVTAQVDPWAERARGTERNEFQPIRLDRKGLAA